MNENKKKAVIYCRVSTKEQVEDGNSLTTQEKLCKEYALKNGYEIAEVFIEQGESAKNADRTQLKRLIEFCTNKKNGIQAVIAYKVDRIARNIDDYRYIRVLLKRYNVEIKSTSEYFEDTPAGRFMENIIANVAQFDNDVRTERSVNGMRDAMREGRYVWIAPFGYSNMKVAGKSTIVPNEKAAVIRKLFVEVAKNEQSVDALRRKLHKEGLTTKKGKVLTKSHTYKLLNNEVYAGWIVKFGERHKGLYEPLVSEELLQQVQRVLKRRAHRGFVYQRENPDFPLRRFIFHPSGKKITGYWAQGRCKRYPYYRFIGIPHSEWKKDALEDAYMQLVDSYRLKAEHIEYLKQAMTQALGIATEKDFKESERLRSYIAELYERQTSLIEKNEKGVISDSVLRQQLDLVDGKLTKAHAELYGLPDKKEDIGELMNFAKEYLENPAEVWQKAPFKTKVELQWFEFPQGVILKDRKFRTAEIASIFRAIDVLAPLLSSRVHLRGQYYEHTSNNKSPPNSTPIDTLKQYLKDINRLAEILKAQPP
jgi:site-specific DNA recombinase